MLPLSHIDLLLKHSDLVQELLPLLLVVVILLSYPFKQLSYLVIFQPDHLSEPIQLNIEELILVIHTFLQIFQLKVENLLKFVPQLV